MTADDVVSQSAPSVHEWNRSAAERDEPLLLEQLRAASDTRVILVCGDKAALESPTKLRYLSPESIPFPKAWAFLGRDGDARPVLAAVFDPEDFASIEPLSAWGTLRTHSAFLEKVDAEVFVVAISIGRWLVAAPFCSACGSRTDVTQAGWSRQCPVCGRQHFPRTDPAVIVAVTDQDSSRLLLGSNAMWESNRYSCFAGFVEAGESLESAVEREVAEECGVDLSSVRYMGSQPWPYPRSLMLGFYATAVDADAAVPDGTEILQVRWFDRAEIGAALAGEGDVLLPGPSSIAARLISHWHAEVS
ncbi:NAD+ diphosphatase [Microbacterium endophyticum]|uniref:NAD(+) diphosphatase n=1 Tax=Microbacterium endophyticum TaxID=1526412 RepID=A0A7W4V0S3_9MICO|nr:NAD(+) diphosphatase [Microbacterium endophyticum]MBB2974762.1 NAD+ diphosphatase [Microbacterium endophyticum]NIK37059.1 NAD+ diphosphatase [Microbacterium endophyticum]